MLLWEKLKKVLTPSSNSDDDNIDSVASPVFRVTSPPMTEKFGAFKLQKKSIHFPYDFDRWFARLKQFTFRSDVLPITPPTARAMVKFYQHYFNIKHDLTREDVQLLKELEENIESSIRSINKQVGGNNGVFVRMSNRSPKDGAVLLPKDKTIASIYETALKGIDEDDNNNKMVAICDVQMQLLRCTESKQVLNLLLTSERVYADLLLALDCQEASKNDEWSTSVILREWQPKLKQDFEFRVFVCNDKVTAISQYNHWCVYDSLHGKPNQELKERLHAYAMKVHPYVNQHEYVIDLAVVGNDILVVELNPFDSTTGACMFDWRADKEILHGSTDSKEPAFRVRETIMPGLKSTVKSMLTQEEKEKREDVDSCAELLHSLSLKNVNKV
jgi:hypothetical protein